MKKKTDYLDCICFIPASPKSNNCNNTPKTPAVNHASERFDDRIWGVGGSFKSQVFTEKTATGEDAQLYSWLVKKRGWTF